MPDDLRDLIVELPADGDGLIPVRRAIARCAACDWTATMTGDDDLELAHSLRAVLLDHVADMHPRH